MPDETGPPLCGLVFWLGRGSFPRAYWVGIPTRVLNPQTAVRSRPAFLFLPHLANSLPPPGRLTKKLGRPWNLFAFSIRKSFTSVWRCVITAFWCSGGANLGSEAAIALKGTDMNCDRVFMVLTRGPFPSGAAEDPAVEDHLLSCASCRRLALALQPAIELFEEATPLDEKDELPTYWGQLVSDTASEGMQSDSEEIEFVFQAPRPRAERFARIESPRRSRRERTDPRSRWPLAGAFLIGIVFCLTTLEWMVNSSGSQDRPPTSPAFQATDAMWSSPPSAAQFPATAALLLCPRVEHRSPDNNVRSEQAISPEATPAPSTNSQAAVCCTECHTAGGATKLTGKSTAQVVLACQGCHNE